MRALIIMFMEPCHELTKLFIATRVLGKLHRFTAEPGAASILKASSRDFRQRLETMSNLWPRNQITSQQISSSLPRTELLEFGLLCGKLGFSIFHFLSCSFSFFQSSGAFSTELLEFGLLNRQRIWCVHTRALIFLKENSFTNGVPTFRGAIFLVWNIIKVVWFRKANTHATTLSILERMSLQFSGLQFLTWVGGFFLFRVSFHRSFATLLSKHTRFSAEISQGSENPKMIIKSSIVIHIYFMHAWQFSRKRSWKCSWPPRASSRPIMSQRFPQSVTATKGKVRFRTMLHRQTHASLAAASSQKSSFAALR